VSKVIKALDEATVDNVNRLNQVHKFSTTVAYDKPLYQVFVTHDTVSEINTRHMPSRLQSLNLEGWELGEVKFMSDSSQAVVNKMAKYVTNCPHKFLKLIERSMPDNSAEHAILRPTLSFKSFNHGKGSETVLSMDLELVYLTDDIVSRIEVIAPLVRYVNLEQRLPKVKLHFFAENLIDESNVFTSTLGRSLCTFEELSQDLLKAHYKEPTQDDGRLQDLIDSYMCTQNKSI